MSGEQVTILLECEVIRELFDDGQKFLHAKNFSVVLAVYFHTDIDEIKISVPQADTPTDTIG